MTSRFLIFFFLNSNTVIYDEFRSWFSVCVVAVENIIHVPSFLHLQTYWISLIFLTFYFFSMKWIIILYPLDHFYNHDMVVSVSIYGVIIMGWNVKSFSLFLCLCHFMLDARIMFGIEGQLRVWSYFTRHWLVSTLFYNV